MGDVEGKKAGKKTDLPLGHDGSYQPKEIHQDLSGILCILLKKV